VRVVGATVEPPDSGLEVSWSASELGSGQRIDLVLRNASKGPVHVERVRLQLDARPERVLEHGWQSWSVVRRAAPADIRPARRTAPAWLRGQLHADPDVAGTVVSGDHFLLTDSGIAGFLDGRHNLGTILAPPEGPLEAVAMLDGVEVDAGSQRVLDPLWLADGDPGKLYSEYADHWGIEAGARIWRSIEPGWCSWYEYYTGIKPEQVLANLELAAEHELRVVQVDDGFSAEVGEWLEPAKDWKETTAEQMARRIADAGCEPGIWTAPFVVAQGGSVATRHPDWLVGDEETGKALAALYNPLWRGWSNALDTTNPAVLDHLRTVYAELASWGFTFQRIDFCYTAAMRGRRHGDGRLTRAEAMAGALGAVREGLGEGAMLISSGCPFGPAVGVVDGMRVSDDTAPYWDPRGAFDGYPEATPAARNAVASTVLRSPLHRRVFVNDPDCLLLRPTGTLLTREERRVVTHAAVGTGGVTTLSDDLGRYGPDEWGRAARIMGLAADADAPLHLADPFATPLVVDGPTLRLEISWEAPFSRLSRRADRAVLLP
jgi:alpha-galactosidase